MDWARTDYVEAGKATATLLLLWGIVVVGLLAL